VSFNLKKLAISLFVVSLPVVSHALPVDWHGTFGVDSTLVSSERRIKSKSDNSGLGNGGSQELGLDAGNDATASWQSYVLRLNPVIIINDAATLKLEFTTGYANGGYLGDSSRTDAGNTLGSSLYYYNQASGQALNVKKAYVELYSDTATYLVGRHSYQWGLGAIYNEGGDAFDRHSYSRDGITMKVKIGNFHMSPFWSRVDNKGLTSATASTEYGSGFLYDNPEKDIAFGALYGLKSSRPNNSTYLSSNSGTLLGETDTKILDFYFKKIFNKFDMILEFPLFSGTLGHAGDAATVSSYNAKAIILQSNYKHNDNWVYGFDAGQVSGSRGETSKFSATYLNPNFQIANLLFRYNFGAVKTNTQSVYDSYITNARYFKFRSTYNSEKWSFDSGLIYALAVETAAAGTKAFNHTTGKIFNADFNQSNSLGTEIDFNAKYRWNNEVSIGSGLGYLITGDYFAFTNTATPNAVKSSMLLQINTAISF
jgi:hypothetical protein